MSREKQLTQDLYRQYRCLNLIKTIPMQEILEDSSLGSVRDKGRGLYARLAKLPPNERAEEVEQLKTAFRARNSSGVRARDHSRCW